jgi:hypothetical protein
MKRVILTVVLLMCGVHFGAPSAHADPPPPPTPPGCHSCGGPPVPPTPVATLAQGTVPVAHTVSVELAPTHIKRGATAKASVSADAADKVLLVVHYHKGKPTTYHATVGSSGKLVKTWKVPRAAPLGKASVKVTVHGSGDPYSTTITVTVVR